MKTRELSEKCRAIRALAIDLNDDELDTMIDLLDREKDRRLHERQKASLAEIMAIADKAGLSIEVNADKPYAKRKSGAKPGSKAKIKYRHGDHEWSGRGIRPKWLQDLVDNGHDIADYLTPEFRIFS